MSHAAITDEFLPTTQTELCRWVGENAHGPGLPIYPVGGRTAIQYGPALTKKGIALCTTGLARVIDYPARDMTITVEAGIRIEELSKILAEQGQRLPIDVPHLHRATLGGVLATNTSGSRRYGLGTMRDYVIGISAVDAEGQPFKAGGRVVKNVAGYDLCKMLVGSLGTLAVVTQVTLKLRPIPETSLHVWITFDRLSQVDQALERLTTSQTRPVSVDLLEPRAAAAIVTEAGLELPVNRPVLCVGFEGTANETSWQADTLQDELRPIGPHGDHFVQHDDASSLWFALTDFQVPSEEPLTFKANLLPSRTVEFVGAAQQAGCTVLAHVANGIVVGQLPDEITTVSAAAQRLESLRALARKSRGNLVVVQCEDSWKSALPLWGEPEPGWPLMRSLKQQLDPRKLFNPQIVF
ncbi:MAG: FAD-binding oxidoreductase [Planctomycetes bacterium]|nr:FAD-binding oxidoreductase [Planctomycetota bacterium]